MRRSLARLLLLLASSCCGIVLIEFSWSLLPKVPAEPDPGGYKLLGGAPGSVYENVGRFYLYRPQTVVRVASYYNGVHDLVKEFEYERHTNNLGLVQKSDVHAGTPSVLILGDSFTEGMGAEPWFEQVVPFFVERNLQPINGGLMGTGFRQWILLHEHLTAQNIVVKKLIVVFISDDYGRNVWNFTKHQLDCFASYLNCKGDEEFYGMPPDSERPAFLRKLRSITDARVARHRLLPATTLAYGEARRLAIDTLWWLRARWRPPTEAVVDDPTGPGQVRYFADRYGKDVVFVHLPVRDELHDGPNEAGVAAREAIREAGAKLFDGFERCGLTDSDYHVHDGHPNAVGYAKIAACVREAAKSIL